MNAHGRNLPKALAAMVTVQEATPRVILGAVVQAAAVQEDRDADD